MTDGQFLLVTMTFKGLSALITVQQLGPYMMIESFLPKTILKSLDNLVIIQNLETCVMLNFSL